MILLVGLVFLPPHAVLLSGALIVFGHNLLATFGRVPLFIYVLHLYAAHAAAVALFLAEGFDFHQLRGWVFKQRRRKGSASVWQPLTLPGSSS
jgi:putative flippase GtrA